MLFPITIFFTLVIANVFAIDIQLDVVARDDFQHEKSCNQHKYETIELENEAVFYAPEPLSSQQSKTSTRYRDVRPSLEPDKEQLLSVDTAVDPTYKTYVFTKLSKCYKAKDIITNNLIPIIFYIAAPGEHRMHQRVRTLIDAIIRRGDQYLFFINCNLPWLQKMEQENYHDKIVQCAKNIAICHNSFQNDNEPYYTHFIGMGLSAQIAATVSQYSDFPPDRITGLDPMNSYTLWRFTKLRFMNTIVSMHKKSAKTVIIFHTNLDSHGMEDTMNGAVNFVVNLGSFQPDCNTRVRPITLDPPPLSKKIIQWRLFYSRKDYCSHEFSLIYFAFNIIYHGGGHVARLCNGLWIINEPCRHKGNTLIRVGHLHRNAYSNMEKGNYYVFSENHKWYYPEVYIPLLKKKAQEIEGQMELSGSPSY